MSIQISIIVPCYNVQKYVQAALQSILDNTQPEHYSRLEIIIINDGSTDNTFEIVEQFLQTCPITHRIINQENLGLSAARNTGMAQARGNYWLFLDSDDVFHHHALDKLLTILDKYTPDLVEFDATAFTQISELDDLSRATLYQNYFIDVKSQSENALFRTFEENRWYVWSRCYHKKLFEKQKFEYGKLFEDFMTIPYVYFAAQDIFRLPESLLGYRQNATSITANISHRTLNDIFYGLQKAITAETHYPKHTSELHILQLKTWRLIVAYAVKQFLHTHDVAYLSDIKRFRIHMQRDFGRDWGWQLNYFTKVIIKRLCRKIFQ